MPADLHITYRPIAALRPDGGNARTHPKKQIAQIAASIREFGFVSPILTDDQGGIIAGHGRLLAAKSEGFASVPTIILDGLSEAQKKALRLADNRIAQNAGWDADLLRVELEALVAPEVSFDLNILGFSSGEIDIVLAPCSAEHDDALPALPTEPMTRTGDIWELGQHRIGCGDARDEAFVSRVMGPDTVADVAFVDAPYNVGIADHAGRRSTHREFAMASGEMTADEFVDFLRASLRVAASASREGAVHFVMMDWPRMQTVQAVGTEVYGALLNLCFWNKSNAGIGSLYRSKHELVFVFRVGRQRHFNAIELGRHGRHRTNVWDYACVTSPRGSRRADLELHPTTKPVAMVADAIKDVTRRGDVVLDPFLGSGTTLIAAERTGRSVGGIEIDPAYIDVAVQRWTEATGIQPKRILTRRRRTTYEPQAT